MAGEHTQVRCTVFHGRGDSQTQALELNESDEPLARTRTTADRVPLTKIMCRDLVCARPDLDVGSIVTLMVKNHVGCIPVVDERRRPVGMITKFDIVEQLEAFMRSVSNGSPLPIDLVARSADEIMMPLALTLDENATVAHAASMMTCEDLHHVLVVSNQGTLVGVVSSKDIVNWLVANDDLAPRRRLAHGSEWQIAEAGTELDS
jgi:CBS domain-containing protein